MGPLVGRREFLSRLSTAAAIDRACRAVLSAVEDWIEAIRGRLAEVDASWLDNVRCADSAAECTKV